MIASFGDAATQEMFNGLNTPRTRQWKAIEKIVARKFDVMDAAADLDDFKVPPGNRLEKLKGDRAGQFSIRINDQWRIVFRWENGGTHDVTIVDYH